MAFAWLQWVPLPAGLNRSRFSGLTDIYVDSQGRFIAEIPSEKVRSHRPIPLSATGPWLADLTVGREDQRFWTHPGVDFRSIGGALIRGRGGASTITQQVVKMATRRSAPGYGTKLYEAIVAFQLEWRWGKERILEEYLNHVPFGNRLHGVEAASLAYFGKAARNVTKDEAAFLVGLPQAPSRFNPWRDRTRARQQFVRTVSVLRARKILQPDEELAAPEVLRNLPRNRAPQFVNAVMNRGPAVQGVLGGVHGNFREGVRQCSLDLQLQEAVAGFCRRHVDRLNRPDIENAAYAVIENQTGAVRALGSVSRSSSGDGWLNGATVHRSCGSTLKPFLYLAGIQRRIMTAATVFPDTADAVREVYADYDPHNFVRKHAGPVRLREALGSSLNVPAVVALGMVGARSVHEVCMEWGIRFSAPLKDSGAGFILGNGGVTLLDLTCAYAGLSRQGMAVKPWLEGAQPSGIRRVSDAKSVEIITDILCDNEARSGSFGWRSPLATRRRLPVKTGTSAGYRDAWTVGFSREHTVGIWVGNLDGRPMSQAASIVAAAPLWRTIMDEIFDGDSAIEIPEATRTTVCALSGLRPGLHSSRTVDELFLPGTVPLETADSWFDENSMPLLPAEYASWCASPDNARGARSCEGGGGLRILVPRSEAVYLFDPEVPANQQQVEFRVSQRENTTWRLNDTQLFPDPSGRVLWQLREGEWTLVVSNETATDTRRFRVIKSR